VEFLREGKEIYPRHCVHYFSFGSFDDLFGASFFDSDDKCVEAASQHWGYLFHAYCCRRPGG
jgi:hypothetical protein